jgi:hypothetical protein
MRIIDAQHQRRCSSPCRQLVECRTQRARRARRWLLAGEQRDQHTTDPLTFTTRMVRNNSGYAPRMLLCGSDEQRGLTDSRQTIVG